LAQGEEWVTYVTEKLLDYVETPRKIRKQTRAIHRKVREPWPYRWFGMVPYAIAMWLKGLLNKKSF
jgi:hypothetical protein